jgi:hypothetical protein
LRTNWATVLFQNNSGVDKLHGVPLTAGEIQQSMVNIKPVPKDGSKFIKLPKNDEGLSPFWKGANATCSEGARVCVARPSQYDLRLSRYFGTHSGFWLRLQLVLELVRAAHETGERIKCDVQPHAA